MRVLMPKCAPENVDVDEADFSDLDQSPSEVVSQTPKMKIKKVHAGKLKNKFDVDKPTNKASKIISVTTTVAKKSLQQFKITSTTKEKAKNEEKPENNPQRKLYHEPNAKLGNDFAAKKRCIDFKDNSSKRIMPFSIYTNEKDNNEEEITQKKYQGSKSGTSAPDTPAIKKTKKSKPKKRHHKEDLYKKLGVESKIEDLKESSQEKTKHLVEETSAYFVKYGNEQKKITHEEEVEIEKKPGPLFETSTLPQCIPANNNAEKKEKSDKKSKEKHNHVPNSMLTEKLANADWDSEEKEKLHSASVSVIKKLDENCTITFYKDELKNQDKDGRRCP